MSKFKEYDKRFGKHPGDDIEVAENKNDSSHWIATFIAFIFQLFLLGPNKNYRNPLKVIFEGSVFFAVNAFFLFSENSINVFMEILNLGNDAEKLIHSFIYLYLMVQCIRGIWIIGGWNQNPVVRPINIAVSSGGIRGHNSRPYYKTDTNHLPNAIDDTYSWMNSKMQSMTPNQRENYFPVPPPSEKT